MYGLISDVDWSIPSISPSGASEKLSVTLTQQAEEIELWHVLIKAPLQ